MRERDKLNESVTANIAASCVTVYLLCIEKGERGDSNSRMAVPQTAALTPWLRSP